VMVVIDGRGPFVRGRVIDLSMAAARRLGMIQNGVVQVRLEVVGQV
jgi:rare lipoprotein A